MAKVTIIGASGSDLEIFEVEKKDLKKWVEENLGENETFDDNGLARDDKGFQFVMFKNPPIKPTVKEVVRTSVVFK